MTTYSDSSVGMRNFTHHCKKNLSRVQDVGMLLERTDKDCVIRIENVKKRLNMIRTQGNMIRTEGNIQHYTKPGSACGENGRCRIYEEIVHYKVGAARRIGQTRYK
jgi:hypothetical protein